MRTATKSAIRLFGRIVFLIYILALVYFLFLSEEYGRRAMQTQGYRYNLILFKEIRRFWVYRDKVGMLSTFLNISGNVIGFLPFGFILPVMHQRLKRFSLVTLLGFTLSLIVETLQLVFKVGCFDVDDLLLNTAGAALGYLIFAVCNRIRRVIFEKI